MLFLIGTYICEVRVLTNKINFRWLYGDVGCQLYATLGLFLGIGIIFSLGLLILDRYLQLVGE